MFLLVLSNTPTGFIDEAAAERVYQMYKTRAYRLEPMQVPCAFNSV
jgi:hypothetical protein